MQGLPLHIAFSSLCIARSIFLSWADKWGRDTTICKQDLTKCKVSRILFGVMRALHNDNSCLQPRRLLTMNQITKRYMRELFLSSAAYVILLSISTFITGIIPGSPWRIPIALVPIIPTFFMVMAFVRYLNGIDELQQRIQLMSLGFSAGVTGLGTFAYGFLETIGFPHLPLVWVFPILIFLWGLGTGYFSRKYQ
jgi:hypothetical protein